MTIDVLTKAGTQVGISISLEELNASEPMQKVIQLLLLGAEAAEGEHNEAAKVRADPPVVPKEKREKYKPGVDNGKIRALWQSRRFSVKDIAEDVGCSEQTVRNTLKASGLWETDEAEADM